MLPNDAYFIIARNMGSYVSGTALKVTRAAEFAPSTLGSPTNPATSPTNYPWTQFEIARDKVAVAQNVPIWVFPPAINNLAAQRENARTDYDFATRSPVVAPDKGVPKRRIAVQ
jgi:hypothetical protein